jgi:hypothetical protein
MIEFRNPGKMRLSGGGEEKWLVMLRFQVVVVQRAVGNKVTANHKLRALAQSLICVRLPRFVQPLLFSFQKFNAWQQSSWNLISGGWRNLFLARFWSENIVIPGSKPSTKNIIEAHATPISSHIDCQTNPKKGSLCRLLAIYSIDS